MRHRVPAWASGAVLLALLSGPAAAAGADLPAAKAFVESLYGAYHAGGLDPLGSNTKAVFSPRLAALIRLDRRLAGGEIGALDHDPVCDCQGFEISDVAVDVRAGGPGRAVAVAQFVNVGHRETITLDLIAVRDQWRVDNIHARSTPDLVAFLRKHAGGR